MLHNHHYFNKIGTLDPNSMQYYYGENRYHYRHSWPSRQLSDSIPDMKSIDEEDRITVRQKRASETGFTGLSILHRLHALYEFDILNDLVFDAMHTLLLRVVKRHLDYFKEKGYIDQTVEDRLNAMPWTAGE